MPFKISSCGLELAQSFRALTVLLLQTWVQSPAPTWQLTTSWNSSSREFNVLFWPLYILHVHSTQMYRQAKHQYESLKKKNINIHVFSMACREKNPNFLASIWRSFSTHSSFSRQLSYDPPAAGPGPHFKPDKIPQHQVTQYPQISQPRKPNSKEEIKKERETDRQTITISYRCFDTVLRSGDVVRHREITSLFKQEMVITLEQVKEGDLVL